MTADTPMEAEGPGVAAAAPAAATGAPEGAVAAATGAQPDAHADIQHQVQAVSERRRMFFGACLCPRMGAPAASSALLGNMGYLMVLCTAAPNCPLPTCRRRRCRLQAPEAPGGQPEKQQQQAFNPNKKRKVALFMAYVGHGYQVS